MDTTYGHTKHIAKTITAIALTATAITIIVATHQSPKMQQANSSLAIVKSNTQYTETKVNKEMIVTAYSILRTEPNESSPKIHTYNRGEKIQVETKLPNNWYKVRTNEKYGYIRCNNIASTKDVFVDENNMIITSVPPDGTVKTNGIVSNSLINYAYNYWYLIPENIRTNFKEQGWTIILTDNSISKRFKLDYDVAGITITDERLIIIHASQSCIRYAIPHEIGHYIDFQNNFISQEATFKNMYLEHGKDWLKYNKNFTEATINEKEYLADLYRIYILQTNNLGNSTVDKTFSNDIKFVATIARQIT